MTIVAQETAGTAPVKLSDRAAGRIAAILRDSPDRTALRITVEGGGCSGFQYRFDLVGDIAEDDIVVRKDGAVLVVDPISIPYMAGSEVDFVQNLMGEELQVKNPLAVASCGCGTSFAI
ncbi:MAG: iron-sulfur cluster assembly accessory protein [Bauldia sp.]|nr:iron-sulfur cluster assembly accessory protein [Bauldia sp.]